MKCEIIVELSDASLLRLSVKSHSKFLNLFFKFSVKYLLSVLFIFDRVDSAAGLGCQGVVKLGIFAEAARVAEKWVLLIVVDGPRGNKTKSKQECYRNKNVTES